MGREKVKNSTTVISIRLLTSLDEQLEKFKKEFGWSKTKIIEYALAYWLNMRDMEAKKSGLAKTQ